MAQHMGGYLASRKRRNSTNSTVAIVDGGTAAKNTTNPLQCVTAQSVQKPGCWILHDVGNDAPCTGCVTSPDDPNWGGPLPRHNARSNNLFADGHVQSQKPSQWYWSKTLWLNPTVGGQ